MNYCTNEMRSPYSETLSERRCRAEKACSELRAQLFCLWTFVAQQGIWEDALDFLDEHEGLSDPFEVFTDGYPL